MCPDINATGYSTSQIGYWETYDGGQIRELDGSQTASINGMDICGTQFVSGGGDKLIKVRSSRLNAVSHQMNTCRYGIMIVER